MIIFTLTRTKLQEKGSFTTKPLKSTEKLETLVEWSPVLMTNRRHHGGGSLLND